MPRDDTHNGDLRPLRSDVDPAAFLREMRRSERRLLMLDYDGTLAPFVAERDRALPWPGVRALLTTLSADARNRVVIISGRAVEDLRPLLGIAPLPEIWGSHGWERLHPDGRYEAPDFPEGLRELFDNEWVWLQQRFDADRLERKPASIALHWRGLSDAQRQAVEREARKRWGPFREMDLLDVHGFDGGLELRAAGRTKGDAVHALLRDTPPDVPSAYCGDDLTDEDAFAALEGRGLRVLVRSELRPTRADVHCIPPEGLRSFLQYWSASA
ncbi:MAG: trehalose-phosphatase [Bacteroidota bacterium]|nr:trehalose-phosphatase [Bacteroidota bacterium]